MERLAQDLRAEFPKLSGLSRSDLHFMRQMAVTWSQAEVVQQVVAQLTWGHVSLLLDRLPDRASSRDWYAARAVAGGWSRAAGSSRCTSA